MGAMGVIVNVILVGLACSPQVFAARHVPAGVVSQADEMMPMDDPATFCHGLAQCPLASRLPDVVGWPTDDAKIWRQPNRSLVDAEELLGSKLDRPGGHLLDSTPGTRPPCSKGPSRKTGRGRNWSDTVGLVAETITADEQGNLYFLEHGAEQGGGRISWAPGGDLARHELFANTGGSPLGGAMTATGDLVYADAEKVRSLHSYLAARCVYFYAPNSIPRSLCVGAGADDGGARARPNRHRPLNSCVELIHA